MQQGHQLLEGHPGGADQGNGAPQPAAYQIPVAHDAQPGDLRFQILAQQHAFAAVFRGCDQACGLFLVVQQGKDITHPAIQLRPVQQVLLAAQKYMGLYAVLQNCGCGADHRHKLRCDLTAQLAEHPGGKIHRCYKGKVAVEQRRKGSCIFPGKPGAYPRHPGADVTGSGHSQHSGCAAAHLHHLVMGDAQILGAGGADGGGAAADGGQRLGSALCQLFRLVVKAGEHRIHPGAGNAVQRLIIGQQVVQIIPVALGAGHTPRAGVGLLQQAQLCQRRHLVAQRCAGHCHIKVVCQHAAAHRLALKAIQRHDRLQDPLLACIHRHSACLLFVLLLFV